MASAGCAWLTANCVTVSDLRITVDSVTVRHLIAEEGNLDQFDGGRGRGPRPARQQPGASRGVSEQARSADVARRDFYEAIRNEPSVVLSKNTYLYDVESSAARCFADAASTPTFRKVRVASGPLKGTEGWTCGPTRPVVPVP